MKLLGRSSPSIAAVAQAPVEVLPYSVRRGRELVASFAQRSDAGNWARDTSNFRDTNSTFILHTADGILCGYRDGDEVEVP